MTTKHATCTHPQTKAGRAACRKGLTPAVEGSTPERPFTRRSARTDIHRPEVFDPEAYDFGHMGTYRGDDEFVYIRREAAEALMRHRADGFRWAGHHDGGKCDHCGAALLDYAVMLHTASHEMIVVGETCLNGRFEMATHTFQNWRKMRTGLRAVEAKRARLAEFMSAHPEAQTILDYDGENDFVNDIRAKLAQYAELSEKQLDAAARAITRDIERKAAQAAREAMKAHLAPLVAGRRVITGKIVSTKWVDSDFGYGGGSLKMLVEDAEGYRYWGTCPAAVDNPAPGVDVTITATIQPKDDDPSFAFFKRPVVKG